MLAVLDSMEGGMSLRAASKAEGVAESTIRFWADQSDEGSAQYAHARARLIDVLTSEIESIADAVAEDQAAVARARLRIDTRKWNLSKIMPKRFGDKVQTEVTGKDGGPLRVARELTEAELLAIAAGAGGQPG